MLRTCFLLSITMLPTALAFAETTSKSSNASEKPCYLFSYFVDNGQDGLHFAYSRDGLKWTAINNGKSLLTPTVGKDRLMRDPSICQGPDGMFHMVWTSSWTDRIIGTSSSPDLIHWSKQKAIPVMMHEPTAKNSWAPEVFYDKATRKYWIVWSTTIPDRFHKEEAAKGKDPYNHRIYCVATKNFKEFSETTLFFNPGFSCIDAYLAQGDGQYMMFYKDERQHPEAKKWIMLTTAPKIDGPYSPGKVISPINWVEGPSVLKIDGSWYVYYDCYNAGHYGAIKSKDLKTWTDITNQISFPKGVRHGTAFQVDSKALEKLLKL